MGLRRMGTATAALALAAAAMAPAPLLAADPSPEGAGKGKGVASCLVCHEAQKGRMWAFFDGVSMTARSIQLKLDGAVEVARFDKETLRVVNGASPDDVEASLRQIRKGHEVRAVYVEGNDGVRFISEISIKPPMKVAAEKLIGTEELETLLAGKSRFTLVDSRPPQKFQEGSIPTAINIPFPAFHKNIDRLPKDRSEPIVFFCAGVT